MDPENLKQMENILKTFGVNFIFEDTYINADKNIKSTIKQDETEKEKLDRKYIF